MTSKEVKQLFALIIGIDIFAVYSGVVAHAIPYWGIAIISNVIGIFSGFFIGAIIILKEKSDKVSNP